MFTLSQRAVAAIVLAPFPLLLLDWSGREPPRNPCGASPGHTAWLAGLAPAMFATGCISLVVVLRISAMRRGRPGAVTLAAVATWLVLAVVWWAVGEDSIVTLWALIAYALLFPAVPVVATLIVALALRPSWNLVTGLAWLSAVVLVPGFVIVIESWGSGNFC